MRNNEKFRTYKDCIDEEAELRFDKVVGCVPPWYTDKKEKYCRQNSTTIKDDRYHEILGNYAFNSFQSNCKPPCQTMKIRSSYQVKNKESQTQIRLYFNPKVTIVKNVKKYG